MPRIRVPFLAALCCVVWWACTDGGGPTDTDRSIAVGIVPSYQIDPSLFEAAPIDRIRLTALDAATQAVIGMTDQSVNPSATRWSLSLGIDLGGESRRQVIVEAELFSAGTVTWSGRLGPITVPSGAPALALDVAPGPLDNFDVLSLSVLGAPTQLLVGASVSLTAELTLVAGSDANPVVYWASTDTAVATVTPTGSTVTLTALKEGTADIVTSVGAQEFRFTLQVLAEALATKTWVGGATSAPSAWSEPSNWNPAGVPTASDTVLVPGTSYFPTLAADAAVAAITVASASHVELGGFTLTVTGDVNGGEGGGLANGVVAVSGAGNVLQGTLGGLLLTAPRSLSATAYVLGDVVLRNVLDTNGQQGAIGGTLTVEAGGKVVMNDPSAVLSVSGDAVFGGADHTDALTEGTLYLGGDLLAMDISPTAFVSSGSHRVSFIGSADQSVTFDVPGLTSQRLNDVSVSNASGSVAFATDARVSGDVEVSGHMLVPDPSTVTIDGQLYLFNGSTFEVQDGATVVATGGCTDAGALILGGGTQPCGSPQAATRTWVGEISGDWEDPNNWTPVGVPGQADTVLVQGAAYDPTLGADHSVASITVGGFNIVHLATFTLTVSGDLDGGGSGFENGLVDVVGPGAVTQGYFDDLRIGAARTLDGSVTTAGYVQLDDTLTVGPQTAYIGGDLSVAGSGVLVMNDPSSYVYVTGNATFGGGDHSGALTAGYLSVAGDLHATAVSATSLVASGTHTLALNGLNGTSQSVTFDVPGPSAQRLNDVEVAYYSDVALTTSAQVSGNVALNGHLTVPAGDTLTIAGVLDLYSGAILEVEAGAVVVASACNVSGGFVLGAGTQPCGTPVTADRIWVGGTAGYEISWTASDNWTPVGAPQVGESVFIPVTGYDPQLEGSVSVGDLVVQAGAHLALAGSTVTVTGNLNAQGFVDGGLVLLTGAGSTVEGYVGDLRLDAPRSVSGYMEVYGTADIRAKLTVSAQDAYLYVDSDLITSGSGELSMDAPTDAIYVFGNMTLGGLRTDLTAGTVYLDGDLIVDTPWSAGAVFYLGGGTDQLVDLTDPGTGVDQQYFAQLYVYTSGVVTFAGTGAVYVTEAFVSGNTTIAGLGLEVDGTFSASGTTFAGVPVRIDTNFTAQYHTLSGLTFTGYATNVTQLFIRMPGDDFSTLTLSSPVFETVPQSGFGYYIEALNALGSTPLLHIQLTSPTPPGVAPPLFKADANTEIIWP